MKPVKTEAKLYGDRNRVIAMLEDKPEGTSLIEEYDDPGLPKLRLCVMCRGMLFAYQGLFVEEVVQKAERSLGVKVVQYGAL